LEVFCELINRPESSVQRGSSQYANFYAGDPLTPFVAATKNAKRIKLEDANVPKIPALPISSRDALPFLKALKGQGVKAKSLNWTGGLDIEYYTGPGGLADLFLTHDRGIKEIWNVMASIVGKDEPDRVTILGCHRDAWV
jgi:N-acetylated-alpha-linked acidic dipeptidase